MVEYIHKNIHKHIFKNNFRDFFFIASLCILCGIFAGLAATAFLYALDITTQTRLAHPALLWLLPFAGFAMSWAYKKFGKNSDRGNNLIFEEIHDPKSVVPARMAPFIFISTVLSHLVGASVGREGTAIQISASLADQLSHPFKLSPEQRKILLVSGLGAGFSAAIGTPWAGTLFGIEVIHVGRWQYFAVIECLIASFVAHFITHLLHAPHTIYPAIGIPPFDIKVFCLVALAGIAFGLTARFFSRLTHFFESLFLRISHTPMRTFIGGALLALFFYCEGSLRYTGLGIATIQESLVSVSPWSFSFFKTLFTSFSIGAGFKGGEFTPLFFIGSTLGSALSSVLHTPMSLLAAAGSAAVFAGASNTPIACSIMAIELFGIAIAPYALVACLISYVFSGHRGIYHAQKKHDSRFKLSRKKNHLP